MFSLGHAAKENFSHVEVHQSERLILNEATFTRKSSVPRVSDQNVTIPAEQFLNVVLALDLSKSIQYGLEFQIIQKFLEF